MKKLKRCPCGIGSSTETSFLRLAGTGTRVLMVRKPGSIDDATEPLVEISDRAGSAARLDCRADSFALNAGKEVGDVAEEEVPAARMARNSTVGTSALAVGEDDLRFDGQEVQQKQPDEFVAARQLVVGAYNLAQLAFMGEASTFRVREYIKLRELGNAALAPVHCIEQLFQGPRPTEIANSFGNHDYPKFF